MSEETLQVKTVFLTTAAAIGDVEGTILGLVGIGY